MGSSFDCFICSFRLIKNKFQRTLFKLFTWFVPADSIGTPTVFNGLTLAPNFLGNDFLIQSFDSYQRYFVCIFLLNHTTSVRANTCAAYYAYLSFQNHFDQPTFGPMDKNLDQ